MLPGMTITPVQAAASFLPTDISGLQGWWRSDMGVTESGGLVSQWDDQSGNGRNLTEATNKPAYSATGGPNSYPSIDFDGTNDQLSVTFTAISQPVHFFAVFKVNALENQGGIVGGSASTQRVFYMGTNTLFLYFGSGTLTTSFTDTTNYHVGEARCNTTSSLITYDNNAGSTGSIGSNTLGGVTLGRVVSLQYANCNICEVLFYDSVLTGSDLTNVRSYLGDRYGISV